MTKRKPLTTEQQKQVTRLVPYLNKLTKTFARTKQEREDCRSAAYLAACIAVGSWDPVGGKSLKSWVFSYVALQIKRDRRFHSCPVTLSAVEESIGVYLGTNTDGDPTTLTNIAALKFPTTSRDIIDRAVWFSVKRGDGTDQHRQFLKNQHASEPNPEKTAEIQQFISCWFLNLPPTIKRAAEDYFLKQLTIAEIADKEQVTPTAVRNRIAVARKYARESARATNQEENMAKRGRKPGSKIVTCPACNRRIVVTAGESKKCQCETELSKSDVARLLEDR